MLDSLISVLAGFITQAIGAGGYAGIALLMAIESACIPLPSEIIMPFSGYLVSTGRFELWAVATAGAVGCNLGSTLAYYVGYWGGRRAVERWGGYLLINPHDLEIAYRFFRRWGAATVFICRLLPVVRTFIALPAGIARMDQTKFQLYTFLGSWPWCWALAYVGMKLGEAWNSDPTLKDALHRFDALIVAALLLGAAWYVWRHLKGARR